MSEMKERRHIERDKYRSRGKERGRERHTQQERESDRQTERVRGKQTSIMVSMSARF